MSAAAITAIVAGGLLQAYGQLKAAEAESTADKANAQVARDNATLTLQQSAANERALRVQGAKALGDIRAGYGANGVTMTGSALQVIKSSASNVEMDALTVRHEGELKAMGLRNEAKLDEYRADMADFTGKLGAASSLLSAGGSAAMGKG
jgi:hypothetical protein